MISKKQSRQRVTETDVALYDTYNYDYETYWKSREYEHESEVHALSRFFGGLGGSWFADIGGSYGRHIPLYADKFKNCVLLDYSLNSLSKAVSSFSSRNIHNVFPVAANVYHLPFRENVFDGAMMVRVIHHLEDPFHALEEISRTMEEGSSFILEYPNKFHLKSIARAMLRLDLDYLTSHEPVQVKTENPEGAERTDRSIMLNYSSKQIKKLLSSHSFTIQKCQPVSFLRVPLLKRVLGPKIMIQVEHMLQSILGWTSITPSIIVLTRKKSANIERVPPPGRLEDILVCPSCKGTLISAERSFRCPKCNLTFSIRNGIPDLRFPQVPPS